MKGASMGSGAWSAADFSSGQVRTAQGRDTFDYSAAAKRSGTACACIRRSTRMD